MTQKYNLDTREKIIQAAARLFMSQGFSKTSTRTIAQEAGITQPNLYHYFPNKEAIYISVIAGELETVGAQLWVQAKNPDLDLKASLQAMVLVLYEYKDMNHSSMHNDIQHSLKADNRDRLRAAWQDSFLDPLAYSFQTKMVDGQKKLDDYTLARLFVANLSVAFSMGWTGSKQDFASLYTEIFLNGTVRPDPDDA